MIWMLTYLASLGCALFIGFLYFRDLGDVSQMVLSVKRENMIRFIRNEYRLLGAGLAAFAVSVVMFLFFDAAPGWLFLLSVLLIALLYGFPWVWVHLGLRNQKDAANYFSIEEAKEWVAPHNSVMVIENNGVARAHPNDQLMRPHLAGTADGLNGENVVMTFCAMTNLGVGYTPEIEGNKLDLEVLAQHGNNLILRDNNTGEPVQQILGFRERDANISGDGPVCPLRPTLAMKPWPTFRMTFRGFERAFPDGTVFLNKPPKNPLLRVLDLFTDVMFSWGIGRQHREAAPVMGDMDLSDQRLSNKAYIWGINLGDDAVCFTDDFVMFHDGPVNTTIDGRHIVLAWHPLYESLGAWWNDSGAPVAEIDFFGKSDRGQLKRVEHLKAGLFWHVWAEFFPHTDINRVDPAGDPAEPAPSEDSSSSDAIKEHSQ